MSHELEFAVDLESVRQRLCQLTYFTSVTNLQDSTLVADQLNAIPPAAFVAVTNERAEPNKTIGGFAQRVNVSISILFCVPAERADNKAGDDLEDARKAVIRILLGWVPDRAESMLQFQGYAIKAAGDGLLWGEVIMTTSYRLTLG
jgi:hypothetical protein